MQERYQLNKAFITINAVAFSILGNVLTDPDVFNRPGNAFMTPDADAFKC